MYNSYVTTKNPQKSIKMLQKMMGKLTMGKIMLSSRFSHF